MKYEGTRKSGKGSDVYTFSVGAEEMELLLRLVQKAHEHSVSTIETLRHHNRLRNLTQVFGKIWVENVKGKKLPTKRTDKIHAKIRYWLSRF